MASINGIAYSQVDSGSAARAVSFMVGEGAESLPGFDARSWWEAQFDRGSGSRIPRALFGACAGDSQTWLGVVAAQAHPGRVGFVWPPVIARSVRTQDGPMTEAIARGLLGALSAWLDATHVQVAQCLLESTSDSFADVKSEPAIEQALVAAGYTHEVHLEYRRAVVQPRSRPTESATLPLQFMPFRDSLRPLFEQTIGRSLVDSADCRFLAGLRTGADLMAAHAGWDEIDPDLWSLAFVNDQAAGVLLLREQSRRDIRDGLASGEISYLGVIPELRGRGAGLGLIERAFQTARRRQWTSIDAAVDATNIFANRLYEQCEFCVEDRLRGRVRLSGKSVTD